MLFLCVPASPPTLIVDYHKNLIRYQSHEHNSPISDNIIMHNNILHIAELLHLILAKSLVFISNMINHDNA